MKQSYKPLFGFLHCQIGISAQALSREYKLAWVFPYPSSYISMYILYSCIYSQLNMTPLRNTKHFISFTGTQILVNKYLPASKEKCTEMKSFDWIILLRLSLSIQFFFFSCKAEQPLQGMELQEKKTQMKIILKN